jgi:hypothetical protein
MEQVGQVRNGKGGGGAYPDAPSTVFLSIHEVLTVLDRVLVLFERAVLEREQVVEGLAARRRCKRTRVVDERAEMVNRMRCAYV